MKNTAVYAGTFDPITFGHIDLIERALRIFDQVIVAIAPNQSKNPFFTLDERVDMVTQVLKNKHVTVLGFNSLLLNFVKEHQAKVILRGLRTVTDFDYEIQLASMNRSLGPEIETVFLMPSEKYMHVSSTLVREIVLLGGDVKNFVPQTIADALYKKVKKSKP